MTLPEWYQNEANASQLADLLKHPTVVRALDVVETANTPAFRSGVSPTDLALVHAFQAGIHHVRRALITLARPPGEAAEILPEWEGTHVMPAQEFTPDPTE
jgi:hypothetical protein